MVFVSSYSHWNENLAGGQVAERVLRVLRLLVFVFLITRSKPSLHNKYLSGADTIIALFMTKIYKNIKIANIFIHRSIRCAIAAKNHI